MVRAKTTGKKKSGNRRARNVQISGWAGAYGAFADIVTVLVDKIGLVGAIFFTSFWFFQTTATPEEKRQIIDMYVLGKGIGDIYPTVIMVLIFAAITFGQHRIYKKKLKVKTAEIDRLSEWKTEHQKQYIKAPLHGSDR